MELEERFDFGFDTVRLYMNGREVIVCGREDAYYDGGLPRGRVFDILSVHDAETGDKLYSEYDPHLPAVDAGTKSLVEEAYWASKRVGTYHFYQGVK